MILLHGRRYVCVIFFKLYIFIPSIIFALLFPLPPSRNSDLESHIRLFPSPLHYGSCLASFSREDISYFFPRRLASKWHQKIPQVCRPVESGEETRGVCFALHSFAPVNAASDLPLQQICNALVGQRFFCRICVLKEKVKIENRFCCPKKTTKTCFRRENGLENGFFDGSWRRYFLDGIRPNRCSFQREDKRNMYRQQLSPSGLCDDVLTG